jgi:hypothetical protein
VPGAQEHINEWFLRHREAADFRAQPICQKIFFRKTQINIFFVTKKQKQLNSSGLSKLTHRVAPEVDRILTGVYRLGLGAGNGLGYFFLGG